MWIKLSKVTSEFHWPGVSSDVHRFVLGCDRCQRSIRKKDVRRVHMGHLPVSKGPFSMMCCDLIGPVQKSERNHRYILIIIDVCTRYPEAIPLKSISTQEVTEALFNVYCPLWIPERIHTDRGGQFTSEIMEEINNMLMMKHTIYSPWHADGNSMMIRVNGIINTKRTTIFVTSHSSELLKRGSDLSEVKMNHKCTRQGMQQPTDTDQEFHV